MNLFDKIQYAIQSIKAIHGIERDVQDVKVLVGQMLLREKLKQLNGDFNEYEIKIFSQYGEDGLIQYLLKMARVPEECHTFVEIGVENYQESNTRFLLINNNWSGLIIDCSKKNILDIQAQPISYLYDLTSVPAFITKDTINDILADNSFADNLGLLSIDIDGNDYWVLESIIAAPILLIVEYNYLLGYKKSVTVPYDALFQRTKAHQSNLYYGSSLKALFDLCEKKGYSFAGANGHNAFFVRNDFSQGIKAQSIENGFLFSKSAQARDNKGRLTLTRGWAEQLTLIEDCELLDLETNRLVKIRDLDLM